MSYTSIANQCENSGTSVRDGKMYVPGCLDAVEAATFKAEGILSHLRLLLAGGWPPMK